MGSGKTDGGGNSGGEDTSGREVGLVGLLPPDVAARVVSCRRNGAVASLVLDAGGLDSAGRAALESTVKAALAGAEGVDEVRVGLMADRDGARDEARPGGGASPASQMSAPQAAARRPLILAVGSGKGGVGKSTLSANLAVALARLGRKVGLVDADIYGPSQPRLMGNEGQRPEAHDSRMFPVPSPWGVGVLSMGHLIEPGKAIAWRGPMASGALSQLVEAHWGDTEILIVDLPPGTGDVQLTMIQKHRPVGAVIVSTSQDLALIDATRAIQLFESAGVPVVGIVENMAGYVCPHCGEVSDPFGSGGAEAVAGHGGHAFLGRVPLTLSIRQESDAGRPPAAGDGPEAQAFAAIARKVAEWLDAVEG